MFGLFDKKQKICAPVEGKVVPLDTVNDEVFSKKLAGDGVAIEPTGEVVVAPCDGMLTLLFKTNHAFAIVTDEGAEILIHIGIDTVDLKGEGFIPLAKQNQKVKAGDKILKFDSEFIIQKGCELTTMVLIANHQSLKSIEYKYSDNVKAGTDEIILYSMK